MEIVFTKHAMEMIVQREISLDEVAQCLFNPSKNIIEAGNTKYIRYFFKANKLLILVCSHQGRQCRIITAIKVSKFKRYLN